MHVMPKSFTQETHRMKRTAVMPFKISQVKPTECPTTTFNLCLVFLMHHTQSLTLFILQPVSFFLRLFSSDGCHYTRYALLELLTQLSLLCLTERLRPMLWLISPSRLFLRWLISSLFPSLFRLLLTRSPHWIVSTASSKDYRNHRLSLCSGTDWLDSSILNRRMWLCCTVWYEHARHFCCGRTASSSRLSAVTQSFRGKQRSLRQSAGRMGCDEPERKLFVATDAWMLSTSWAPCRGSLFVICAYAFRKIFVI